MQNLENLVGTDKEGLVKEDLTKEGLVKKDLAKDGLTKDGLIKEDLVKDGLTKEGIKVGFLGPAGTFTGQAAGFFFPVFFSDCADRKKKDSENKDQAKNDQVEKDQETLYELISLSDIDNIFDSLRRGEITYGVVPLENSTEGPVNATLDGLLRSRVDSEVSTEVDSIGVDSTVGSSSVELDQNVDSEVDLVIYELLILPVSHALMGAFCKSSSESSSGIRKILAHPQALAQCRGYIRRHYPNAELVPCSSNGEAAMRVSLFSEGLDIVAIGPIGAAKEYGLKVLAEGIQDSSINSTAFIKVGRRIGKVGTVEKIKKTASYSTNIELTDFEVDFELKEGCRTSIAFSTENRPGALYRVLGIFEGYNINMTKILSRPMPDRLGEYVFFVDIEGYQVEEARLALKKIEEIAVIYKFLGSYPVIYYEESLKN